MVPYVLKRYCRRFLLSILMVLYTDTQYYYHVDSFFFFLNQRYKPGAHARKAAAALFDADYKRPTPSAILRPGCCLLLKAGFCYCPTIFVGVATAVLAVCQYHNRHNNRTRGICLACSGRFFNLRLFLWRVASYDHQNLNNVHESNSMFLNAPATKTKISEAFKNIRSKILGKCFRVRF